MGGGFCATISVRMFHELCMSLIRALVEYM